MTIHFGRLVAATVLSLGALAAVTPVSPAQAAPPLCFKEYELMKVGASIRAYGYRYCDDQPPAPLSVSVQRWDPAGAVWRVVAQGMGEAKFNCFGTDLRKYRHSPENHLTLTANCT
ncbi:hypothetical protein WEI85_44315 [Actinomycetes bacterium KLBMP 9797]